MEPLEDDSTAVDESSRGYDSVREGVGLKDAVILGRWGGVDSFFRLPTTSARAVESDRREPVKVVGLGARKDGLGDEVAAVGRGEALLPNRGMIGGNLSSKTHVVHDW